ncbi:Peroxiredoxin [Halobacteroides halobius DSM 5150]|uniref:Peroxiredoxin n=1 Tax=Halobacteroides halobius (strain ATCC 35273 / DSM 5150 / MD-1) TaxID=748449 RepID=L0KA55_HALHC|nr:TlpA disulfide reductase family protein [Halobacteroides halobius]AGB41876.1 Peroxiredoxin [Halobacteroides halobius DSM 5150]
MKNSFKFLLIAILVVGIVSLGVLYHKQGLSKNNSKVKEKLENNQEQKEQEEQKNNSARIGINVGNIAPDFTLVNLKGEQVSLSDYRGQFVMVNFWATWCPPCRAEMPDLDAFYDNNKQDFVILGVNIGESKAKVKSFIEENGYDYPILLDQERGAAFKYRVSVIPTSYFVGPQGKIQYVKRGTVNQAELNQIKKNIASKLEK